MVYNFTTIVTFDLLYSLRNCNPNEYWKHYKSSGFVCVLYIYENDFTRLWQRFCVCKSDNTKPDDAYLDFKLSGNQVSHLLEPLLVTERTLFPVAIRNSKCPNSVPLLVKPIEDVNWCCVALRPRPFSRDYGLKD